MLMNLADEDLELTCKVPHPLHRRKIIMAIDRIKDDELDMRWGGGPNDLDEFIATLDGDRIRLIARLKVVFDRADSDHDGQISVFELRVAFEELGRNIATERVASFLVDRESENSIFSFPDFAAAYTELFSAEDPEVRINTEAQTHFNRQIKIMRESKRGKVSHVKLHRRKDKHDPYGEAGPPRANITDGPHHYDRTRHDPDEELEEREKRDRVRDLVARDRELIVGARVEVNLGGTRFRDGAIDRVHVGGEFDIRYDDGTKDTYVGWGWWCGGGGGLATDHDQHHEARRHHQYHRQFSPSHCFCGPSRPNPPPNPTQPHLTHHPRYVSGDKVNPAGTAARVQADVADEVERRRGGKSALVEEALVSVCMGAGGVKSLAVLVAANVRAPPVTTAPASTSSHPSPPGPPCDASLDHGPSR